MCSRLGAAYRDWPTTARTVVIIMAPYAGWAIVVIASRGVVTHMPHLLP
ncbi:MAG: hypothetical protein ACRDRJ_29635 [Streptosporangiaceae bacterium]